MVPFGSSPKISTPVENIVEKRRQDMELQQMTPVFHNLLRGEAVPIAVFRASVSRPIVIVP